MFNVTYWPYVQVSTAYNCISLFFADSFFNLNLDNAMVFGVSLALASGLTVGSLLL